MPYFVFCKTLPLFWAVRRNLRRCYNDTIVWLEKSPGIPAKSRVQSVLLRAYTRDNGGVAQTYPANLPVKPTGVPTLFGLTTDMMSCRSARPELYVRFMDSGMQLFNGVSGDVGKSIEAQRCVYREME